MKALKTSKAVAMLLAVLTVLSSILVMASTVSAGSHTNNDAVTYGNTGTDHFAEGNYNNEEFTFLNILNQQGGKDYYNGYYLDSESYTGATIEDAVYDRNLAVEDKYNVVITQRNEIGDPADILQTLYMSGDFSFDVVYGWGYKMGSCIPENYFADFSTLPNIDLTQEYWCPAALEDLTINDKLYLCISDISMNKLEWGGLVFYNKNLSENYNVERTFGSFYDLVRDGKWTLDKYLEVVKSVSTDIDGNGYINRDDVYGLIEGDKTGLNLAMASGVNLASKNDDGSYSLSYYSEKSLDIANKIQDVYRSSRYVMTYDRISEGADITGYDDIWEYSRSFFARDHALFLTGSGYIAKELRDMESKYGILPLPKYNENQTDYIATVDSNAAIFAIPSTYRNDVSTATPERTGAILEYMSYKSNQILVPGYYDTLLKGQRLNSEDDRDMLDIIRNSTHYDFASMMGLTDITANAREIFGTPNTASSNYTRQRNRLQKQLNDFYAEVLLLPDSDIENTKNGWVNEGGKWAYYENNVKVTNKWKKDSTGWCYLGSDGYMLTNKWVKDSIGWCYVGANGYMVYNKWVKDSIGWCHVGANGYMEYNKWVKDSIGWCHVGANGYMEYNKWVKDSVGWCHVGASGYMEYNKWVKDSIGWCHVGASGYMEYNKWVKDSVGWCYVGSSGYMVTNAWVSSGGQWYYMNASGYMVTGRQLIGGKYYTFNSSGVWVG